MLTRRTLYQLTAPQDGEFEKTAVLSGFVEDVRTFSNNPDSEQTIAGIRQLVQENGQRKRDAAA